MSKKMKKFLVNIEAKVKVSAVAVLMILVALSAFMLIPDMTIRVQAAETTDFQNYKQIWIQHAKVGATLSNFPVWVYRSSDSDLVGLDSEDIAFFASDNSTQLNHEIEVFDTSNGEIGAWVNVTTISSSANTSLYMYYDDVDSTSEENVADTWDGNYVLVLHMYNYSDTQVNDSSGNTNHGTKNSTQATGKMGYGQTFVRADEENVNCGNDAELNLSGTSSFTLECWFKTGSAESQKLLSRDRVTATMHRCWYLDIKNTDEKLRFYAAQDDDGDPNTQLTGFSTNTLTSDVWIYAVLQVDWNGDDIFYYQNGSLDGSGAFTTTTINPGATSNDLTIGIHESMADALDGEMDEVRISNISRSSHWIYATYNTSSSPSTFLAFGAEGGVAGPPTASSFSLSGLDSNDRITWSGEANTTVWSNATSYGTLTIQTNVNGTDNCTDIFLDIADFDSTIDADNISIEVRNTADGSWDGNTKSFLGVSLYNITLNTTTWAENWCHGTDPFPMDAAGWTNVTMEVRFKCAIPGDAGTGTYVNTSASWNVKWKVMSGG